MFKVNNAMTFSFLGSRHQGSWINNSCVPGINEEGILMGAGDGDAISTQFIEWSSR